MSRILSLLLFSQIVSQFAFSQRPISDSIFPICIHGFVRDSSGDGLTGLLFLTPYHNMRSPNIGDVQYGGKYELCIKKSDIKDTILPIIAKYTEQRRDTFILHITDLLSGKRSFDFVSVLDKKGLKAEIIIPPYSPICIGVQAPKIDSVTVQKSGCHRKMKKTKK